MIIVYCCAFVLLLSAVILRGKLARLAEIRLRGLWLVWVALADQLGIILLPPAAPHWVYSAFHIASYVAAAAFVWVNRRIPGALLVFVGGAMNTAAIFANGGEMPATVSALKASGWHPMPGHFANSGAVAHAKLQWLGDIFATPRWFPGHDVFSAGDVIIVVGFALLIFVTCTRRQQPGSPLSAMLETDPSFTQPGWLEEEDLWTAGTGAYPAVRPTLTSPAGN